MILSVLVTFLQLFIAIFNLILLVRVIASYVAPPEAGWYVGLVHLTEPVLAPVRRLLPQMPGVDLAPLVTFFLLQGVQYLVNMVMGSW